SSSSWRSCSSRWTALTLLGPSAQSTFRISSSRPVGVIVTAPPRGCGGDHLNFSVLMPGARQSVKGNHLKNSEKGGRRIHGPARGPEFFWAGHFRTFADRGGAGCGFGVRRAAPIFSWPYISFHSLPSGRRLW